MIYMMSERFNRNVLLFGEEGQKQINASCVAVIGIGGLGTHVVQQLAILGVGCLVLIDDEELDTTNLNRYVGARYNDPIPGTLKVDIAHRMVQEINPAIIIKCIPHSLMSDEAFRAIVDSDFIFGCLDNEGSRLILTELCAAYSKPYIDLSSEIIPGNPTIYGGRICIAWDGNGCLMCFQELDIAEAQADLESPDSRLNRQAIYGIPTTALGQAGPSVVSINGVIASMAVTEFMVGITGIRPSKRFINYRGDLERVTYKEDPATDCYYCQEIRGKGDAANVQRYIKRIKR
jgi:molybdopterin/thiamine biosynthesis adenylyltransferase